MERIVFVELERSVEKSLTWLRIRPIFMSALRRYPASSLSIERRGRVYRKLFLCLKRHEALWLSILSACGWRVARRYEVSLQLFESVLRKLYEMVKDVRRIASEVPEIQELLGMSSKSVEKLLDLLESYRKRLEEYKLAPQAVRNPNFAKTSFLRELRRGKIYAVLVAGTDREALERELGICLRILIERAVLPIDYSLNQILVLKSLRRRRGEPIPRFYAARVDPERVLEILRRPPAIEVVEVDGEKAVLEFEERDIGYGLKVLLK